MVGYVATGIIFSVLEPAISFTGTRHARSCLIKILTKWLFTSTGGVFIYLPHHLDLASEDSVGHGTCMSVLARLRAIMGSIVQPKRSCLGAAACWSQ